MQSGENAGMWHAYHNSAAAVANIAIERPKVSKADLFRAFFEKLL